MNEVQKAIEKMSPALQQAAAELARVIKESGLSIEDVDNFLKSRNRSAQGWPRIVKLYTHSSGETVNESLMNQGFSEDEAYACRYLGYEHEIQYEVQENGDATVISIDGKAVSQ